MKIRWFLLLSGVSMGLGFFVGSVRAATVVTFDDLSETGSGSFIANGYQGLVWSNFGVKNAVLYTTTLGTNGFYYGIVSLSNVAYNGLANPAEIDSMGTDFSFLSTYLTGAVNSNLNVEVQGFRGGTLLYDQTVVAGATNSTMFTFNYLDIDRLRFNAFGGETAFGTVSAEYFVMDNLTFEFVPEPSSLLLTSLGLLSLWAIAKRRRT